MNQSRNEAMFKNKKQKRCISMFYSRQEACINQPSQPEEDVEGQEEGAEKEGEESEE